MRPHVVINAAMSVDGKIAFPDARPAKLSNAEDTARVHRLRAESDAILVGVGTVLKDDPKLTVKPENAQARHPLRVVLDSDGKTPDHAHVLDGAADTLIATTVDCTREFSKAKVFRAGKDEVDLVALLDHLSQRGVQRLLVEGGSATIWSFLRLRLADELKVFVASAILGGHSAPSLTGGPGVHSMEEAFHLKLDKAERLGDGLLLEYTVVH